MKPLHLLTLRAFTGLVIGLLCGCQSAPKESSAQPVASLKSLQTLSSTNSSTLKIGHIRVQALRDTALSIGARGGLAFQANRLNQLLVKQEALLYRVFNFRALMLEKNVLPPVLIEGRNTLDISGTDAIRIADRNYQILEQAKFVTAPPTWRQYLWMSYSNPESPDRSLLPKTKLEKTVWKRYIAEGWEAGMQQAELIFAENLGRIKRDYEGMVRYRSLLAQNMVSAPYVAQTDMGITGDSSNVNINDRILRITAFPELQMNPDLWKTEITPHVE